MIINAYIQQTCFSRTCPKKTPNLGMYFKVSLKATLHQARKTYFYILYSNLEIWKFFTHSLNDLVQSVVNLGPFKRRAILRKTISTNIFLFLFLSWNDCSLPYCATLAACNWFVAGQHLNAGHPRSPLWSNQNVTLFSGNYFLKNFKRSLLLNH